MQGAFVSGRSRYRCQFPAEYALANEVDHPRTVYVREDHALPTLDTWLAEAFSPDRIESSLIALADVDHTTTDAAVAGTKRARHRITECVRKLARYKAALEAGTDPAVVASWIQHTQTERAAAAAEVGYHAEV